MCDLWRSGQISTGRATEPYLPGRPPLHLGPKREPGSVERVDRLPHMTLGRGGHLRDHRHWSALHRGQHDAHAARPNPILERPGDPHQPLSLLRLQLEHEPLAVPASASPPTSSLPTADPGRIDAPTLSLIFNLCVVLLRSRFTGVLPTS